MTSPLCSCHSAREQLIATVAQQYTDGRTIKQIAADLDRSYSFVHRLLVGAGVVRRGRGGNKRRPRLT